MHANVVLICSFTELLQSQPLDSREVADLLRQVTKSFRFQNSASMFKFDKVEFVNNDRLRQKVNETAASHAQIVFMKFGTYN